MSIENLSLEKIQIDSKEKLRAELGITTTLEIPEISQVFEVTRSDLEAFKKTLENLPSLETTNRLRAFIQQKTVALNETQNNTNALKKVIGVGVIPTALATLSHEMQDGIKEIQNAEGLDMVDKASSFFYRMGKVIDKLIIGIASTSFGRKILDFFGVDIPVSRLEMPSVKNEITKVKDQRQISEEKKKEINEEIFQKVSTNLKNQYGLDVNAKLSDGTTKGDKLRSILKKRSESIHDIFIDKDGVVNFNTKNIAELTGSGFGIVYELVREGVIDISSIKFDFFETTKGTIRYIARSISGVEMSPAFGGEVSLASITENMTSSEKIFLLAIFYRKGGFITSILGDVGYILAQPMRLLNVDNVSTLSVLMPGVDRKIAKLDQVIATLTKIAPEKTADIVALKEMKNAAELSKKAIESVAQAKSGKITYAQAQAELGILKQQYKPLGWLKTGAMELSGMDSWNKAYMKDLFISHNANYIDTLTRSMDPSKIRTLERLHSHAQFLDIPGNLNKTAMYFKTPKDFSTFMKEFGVLASQSPELVKGFFTHLPVFVIGGTVVHEGIKPDGDVVNALKYFIPLYGPYLMLSEANVKIDFANRTIDMEKMTEGIIGATLLTLDGYILTKLVISKGGKGALEFAVKPVVDVVRALGSLNRLSGSLWKVGADGARLTAAYIKKFPGSYAKLAVGTLAGISILLIGGELLASDSPEDIKKKLSKKGLLHLDGTPNIMKVKESLATLTEANKKQILDLIVLMEISSYQVDEYIKKTEYKNSIYTITTTTEHKVMLEKTLLSTNLYTEFALIDNIQIETISA